MLITAFTGYGMPPGGRPMMSGVGSTKLQHTQQMEMPRLPNGPISIDWQAKMNVPKTHTV